MKKNNDSIELESNSKRPRVEVDLINLPGDPSLRKKKGVIIILMIKTKYENHFYKKDLVNLLIMTFQEKNLEK
jgi:hypothetical protein